MYENKARVLGWIRFLTSGCCWLLAESARMVDQRNRGGPLLYIVGRRHRQHWWHGGRSAPRIAKSSLAVLRPSWHPPSISGHVLFALACQFRCFWEPLQSVLGSCACRASFSLGPTAGDGRTPNALCVGYHPTTCGRPTGVIATLLCALFTPQFATTTPDRAVRASRPSGMTLGTQE